jgi:hypothetical protein
MTPFEIVAGSLRVWLAPVATVFPLINVAPAAPWASVGTNGDVNYDDEGVKITHKQKVETARPAGLTMPVKAWRTEEDLMIGLTLWDFSLAQYTNVLGGLAPATTAAGPGTAGFRSIGLSRGPDVAIYALLARGEGMSPDGDGFNFQFEVPRVYQSGDAKPVIKKGKPAGLELEWMALADLTAEQPQHRFGRIKTQHQAPI